MNTACDISNNEFDNEETSIKEKTIESLQGQIEEIESSIVEMNSFIKETKEFENKLEWSIFVGQYLI